jgi:hypothetical protein
VAFWVEVALVLVKVHPFLSAATMYAECLLSHVGKNVSNLFDFYKLLPGVVTSQPLPVYAQESPLCTCVHLRLDGKVALLGIAFSYCSAQYPSFGHASSIQCQAHVGLVYMSLTSGPCHSSRHV